MSALVFALVAESIALVAALYFLLLRGPSPAPVAAPSSNSATPFAVRTQPDAELNRRTQELAEARAQLVDLRDQLKRAKRDRFDQRQSDKEGQSLAKEREQVERAASQQLEAVRAELANALMANSRIKSELEVQRSRKVAPAVSAPTPALTAPAPAAVVTPEAPPQRVIRELNPTELARIEMLEHRSSKDRVRAADLEKQLKQLKDRSELTAREFKTVKSQLELARDKFKALEKRLNRTLLERDLTLRAIHQLERESGKVSSEPTALTAQEAADSDARTEVTQREDEAAELTTIQQAQAAAPLETTSSTEPGAETLAESLSESRREEPARPS